MKKIISIILSFLMMAGTFVVPNKVDATFTINRADLYSKGNYIDYLHWNGMGLVFDYVVYEKDGKEYPAYCLTRELTGVTEDNPYSVNVDGLLTNVKVWRAIINGYPYKSLTYLGCETEAEAYMATKQAVYCMLYDRDPGTYTGREPTGVRTRYALKQIVMNARASTEEKVSADLIIEELTNKWELDNINNKYIAKKYTVKANSTINTYSVELENVNVDGTKIVDEHNNEKTTFNYGENFKVIMPIKNMQTDGSFNIKANGKVLTKPILYAYSNDPSKQDYALTGELYEDGSGVKTVNYTRNETKIKILKQDEKGNPLEGVKFKLLNENKEILHTELTTNEKGEVIIENLAPGIYYLEETSTINGYTIYEEPIEVKVTYNEELTIKVTNTKEIITEEEPELAENEKEVINETKAPTTEDTEIIETNKEVIVKLPKTGM